ncbi:MAG TPA: alpha/beta hydrolase fold domain-containing protein [Kofleriaceae bacterium]|nr:alpha/beta hydrolase fold domain-containing protein [Kofleriaceae bacterium]
MLSRPGLATDLRRARGKVAHTLSSTFLRTLANAARLHPRARPGRHQVEVDTDLRYRPGTGPEHVLDLYRPVGRPGPLPVVFYVHGGAFQILSKDTHWLMGLAFARHGYLVANISYRLAPRHRFPAAIDDTCAAWLWLLRNLERLGGDPSRIVVAGESAGGNLVTALTLATVQRRAEPYAREVFDAGVVPRAAMPFCAVLEVSRGHRHAARRPVPDWVDGMMRSVEHAYLGHAPPADCDLADPLCVFERAAAAHDGSRAPAPGMERPLPPFFAPVGTRDPLLDDTRRLEKALARLQVPCEARYYPDEIHAFHALVWRRQARACWRDALAFLDRHLRDPR